MFTKGLYDMCLRFIKTTKGPINILKSTLSGENFVYKIWQNIYNKLNSVWLSKTFGFAETGDQKRGR